MLSKAHTEYIDHFLPLESPLMIAERAPAFNRLLPAPRHFPELRETLKAIRERLNTWLRCLGPAKPLYLRDVCITFDSRPGLD